MNWRRSLSVLALTFFVGPILGAQFVFLAVSAVNALDAAVHGSMIEAVLGLAMAPVIGLTFTPFAFVFAGPAALLAGLCAGLAAGRGAPFGYLAAVAVAVLANLIATPLWFGAFELSEGGQIGATAIERAASLTAVMVIVSLPVAVSLRWLAGRLGLVGRRDRTSAPPFPPR